MKETTVTSQAMTIYPALLSEEEVYAVITNIGRKPKTATNLKQSLRVVSKWFIENIVAPGQNDFIHPFQSLFLYPIHSNWGLNIGYSIFKYVCTTYRVISSSPPPGPYGMLLTVILSSFDGPLHRLKLVTTGAINTGSIKLMNLQVHPNINVVPPCQHLSHISVHLPLHRPLTLSLHPTVTLRHSPLLLFL